MAKYGSADVGLFVAGGYSLLGILTDISTSDEAVIEDTYTFGNAWAMFDPAGVSKFTLTQNGFYDDAAGSQNVAFTALNGSSQVIMLGIEGNVAGKKFIGYQAPFQSKYARVTKTQGLHRANAEYAGSGASETGRLLHALAAETTATGNTTAASVDNGASSANGAAAYAEVTALTLGGYTDVTLKARHSADNITFADLATFTNFSGIGGQRVAVAGTVNRYLAASWAFNGSGTAETITFALGVARG